MEDISGVTVYTMPSCPWCEKVKEFLKKSKIEFQERNVIGDLDARREAFEKSGQRGVPVLDIDGTIIVGYKVERIQEALKMVQMSQKMYDLVAIGGGVAGIAAAIYAGRFMMKSVLVAESLGGTIISTDDIANYPGFSQITGLDLIKRFQDHLADYDLEVVERKVTRIEKCEKGCFKVFMGEEYFHTKAIVLATGTDWKKLEIPGEDKFAGRGVHYCALCDGAFYQDKVVGVVGGSDSAAKEALLLSDYAKKVYIIYRGEKIRPEPINLKRVEANEKIEMINETNVLEIKGEDFVSSVILDRPFQGLNELDLSALFVDIGHFPLSDLARDVGAELNEKGEVKIDREAKTNVQGLFAAGDVVNTSFKQAITGVAEGVTAAYSAYVYVNENEVICPCDDEEEF